MTRVLDLGAGENPHSDATTTMDVVDLPGIDVVHDATDRPWPFDDNEFDRVTARHVLEHIQHPEDVFHEVARILTDEGRFEVVVPLGLDARTDPTHVHEWTYETPAYFAAGSPYDYGWNLPYRLVARRVDAWYNGPGARVGNRVLDALLDRHGPGKWLSGAPGVSGELTAIYRRVDR